MTDQNQSSSQPGQDWRPQQTQPKLPLGVGTIIAQSFSILFRNFFRVFLAGVVPSVLGYIIPLALVASIGSLSTFQQLQLQPEEAFTRVAILGTVWTFLQIAVYAITAALLVQLAYDAKLSRPVRLLRYVKPAISAVLPIIVLGIAVSFLLVIAMSAFFLVGSLLGPAILILFPVASLFYCWIVAVFVVTAPAIVIERVGLRGLKRSAELTKEYRWPIVGTLALAAICFGLINTVIGGVATLFFVALVSTTQDGAYLGALTGSILPLLLYSTVFTIGTGLVCIVIALIYARLREIKEGISVDQIAAVFE